MERSSFDDDSIKIKTERLKPLKYIPPRVTFWKLHSLESDLYSYFNALKCGLTFYGRSRKLFNKHEHSRILSHDEHDNINKSIRWW